MDLSTATPQQRAAVTSTAQNKLVLAGPGSGKTRTIVWRIEQLLRTEEPGGIVAITFTNAAAKEIAKRLDADGVSDRLKYVGTIHGWALRCLQAKRETAITVMDDTEADLLMMTIAKDLKVKASDKAILEARRYPSEWKNNTLRIAATRYHQMCRAENLMDFDTILVEYLNDLRHSDSPRPACTHLIVDEFQDSGTLDYAIYKAMLPVHSFFVGDPDQAIYSFRGGNVGNILEVARRQDFEVHFLEGNFRSGRNICTVAQRLIERNAGRVKKATVAMLDSLGMVTLVKPFPTDSAEANGIAQAIATRIQTHGQQPNQIAVLVRTNAQVVAISDALRAVDVPVAKKIRPKRPADWLKARVALELLNSPANGMLLERWLRMTRGEHQAEKILEQARINQRPELIRSAVPELANISAVENVPSALARMGVSRESIEAISERIGELVDPTIADVAFAVARDSEVGGEVGHGVTVTTMHAAKGREWPMVVVAGAEQEITPGRKEDNLEEERRLFYVAITRAQDELVITHARKRKQPWGDQRLAAATRSQFVAEATFKAQALQ